MTDSVLAQAVVYLCAAVVFVPIAKRVGLGAVLGYLLAGVAIGPFVLGLVGTEGHHVMHFAELGVVMMLFLVGLELRPSLLWEMRRPIFGLGGMQVVATTVLLGGVALAAGLSWKPALAVGMLMSMSSTAIVLSSLAERGMLKSRGGQASFSVLLFQDIAVIPILAIFPLLAAVGSTTVDHGGAERPAWLSALLVLGAVALVVGAGRYVIRPIFQFLAMVRLRESFTAFALLLVLAIALLMQAVGLSPALGTFLAGVVLADSEYRHELESDVEPFKGLLLGLFFISVGAQVDFALIAREPLLVLALVAGSMLLKLGILLGLTRAFGLDRPARWLCAFALPQIGEFAFVLISFAQQSKIFGVEVASPLVASVAISMLLTPLLFILLERRVLPLVTAAEPERVQDDIPEADAPVIIAGHGRFGQVVGRILRASGFATTVLDLDPEIVDILGRLGVKVYYGDASRLELLEAAGCARARLFVLAVDEQEVANAIAETVRKHFPDLPIIARARDRVHYFELSRLGVRHPHRETFAAAWEAGIEALRALGMRANTAHRIARRWRDHEERSLQDLMTLWGGDRDLYFARARRAMEEAERLMRQPGPGVGIEHDAAWNNESLRADPQPERMSDAGP
jgi:glutathione-regulated potassium-efflux system ancillary protein KefC